MGIGKNRVGTLLAVWLAVGVGSALALERNTGIWPLLRAAHFPGPMVPSGNTQGRKDMRALLEHQQGTCALA